MLGKGPSNDRNTTVHSPHPPPNLKNCLHQPFHGASTPDLPPVGPVISARGGAGRRAGERAPGAPEARPPARVRYGQSSARPPGRRLRTSTSRRGLAGFPPSLTSLIKPVHLITGRSIKYFYRFFRCSLWALVKAGEASDQLLALRRGRTSPLAPMRLSLS